MSNLQASPPTLGRWARRLLALSCLVFATAASAYQKGDWVLAKYKNGPFWFPGVVESDTGRGVTVVYDDGDRETLPSNLVKNYNWAPGSVVECNFKSSGKWFRGKITTLSGEDLSITYDDGDKERTKTGLCRSR